MNQLSAYFLVFFLSFSFLGCDTSEPDLPIKKCRTDCDNGIPPCNYTENKPENWGRSSLCILVYYIDNGNPSNDDFIHEAFQEWIDKLNDFNGNPSNNLAETEEDDAIHFWTNFIIRFEDLSGSKEDYENQSGCKGAEPLASRSAMSSRDPSNGAVHINHIITINKFGNWDNSNPDSGCESVSLKNAIIHEIGHALGLGHTEDINSIMHCFSRPEIEQKLTDQNVRQVLEMLPVAC